MTSRSRTQTASLHAFVFGLILSRTDCGNVTPGGTSKSCYVSSNQSNSQTKGLTNEVSNGILNCDDPASRVCLSFKKESYGVKVTIQTCPSVGRLRLQLTRPGQHFDRKTVRSSVKSCTGKNDSIVLKRPRRQHVLRIVSNQFGEDKTNPGVVWSYKNRNVWSSWSKWRTGTECGKKRNSYSRQRRAHPDNVANTPFVMTDLNKCGTERSCIRFGTKNCRHLECDYLLTYDIVNHTMLHLEISGKTDGWVALGLSSDNKMGGDDVIVCKRKSVLAPSLEALSMGMNVPNSRPRKHTVNDLTLIHARMEEEFIYCKMTRNLANEGVLSDYKVDLTNNWYQLYGKGEIDRNGVMLKHQETPPTSVETITMLRPFKSESLKYEQSNSATSIFLHFSCLTTLNIFAALGIIFKGNFIV